MSRCILIAALNFSQYIWKIYQASSGSCCTEKLSGMNNYLIFAINQKKPIEFQMENVCCNSRIKNKKYSQEALTSVKKY